jgi:hypothetical protein
VDGALISIFHPHHLSIQFHRLEIMLRSDE